MVGDLSGGPTWRCLPARLGGPMRYSNGPAARTCRCGVRLAQNNPGPLCAPCGKQAHEATLQPPEVPEAAEQAGDRVLSAYVIASRGRVATFEGDHKEIRDVGFAAIDRAGTGRHVSGRMLAWLYTLEARGCAGMGDLAATERALAQAERALSEGGRAEPGPDMDFFDFTRLRALAGECYVFLRKPRLARANLEETLRLLQPEQRKRRAMVELDLARAYVQAGQVAEAYALAGQALGVGDDSFTGPLAQRVRDFQTEIAARR